MTQIFNISYSVWTSIKNQTENAGWSVFYREHGGGYDIFTGHRDYVYVSGAFDADKTDFDTNFKSSATQVYAYDDGVACLVGMTVQAAPLNDKGQAIVAPGLTAISEAWRSKGNLHYCPSGVSIHDRLITSEILIDTGEYWTIGAHRGDTSDFSIIDKDDILGYHTALGLPAGYPLELKKYIDEKYMYIGDQGNGNHQGKIAPPTVAPVASGLYARHVYTNIGPDDVWMGVDYEWYEDE